MLHKSLKPKKKVLGHDMRFVLDTIPNKLS
jgi:hypothetical protein